MNDQHAMIAGHQQIFCPPAHGMYDLLRQNRCQIGGYRPAQPRMPHGHLRDALASQMGRNPASGDLDFWQFRHNQTPRFR